MNKSVSQAGMVWVKVLVLPAILGWLYARAFPPVGFRPWVAWSLMGFMMLLKGMSSAEARRAGFVFGYSAFGFGLAWMWNMFKWLSLALYGSLALNTMFFAWGCAVFERQRWHPVVKVLAMSSLWTGIEFARSELHPLNFPWLTAGHAVDTVNSAEMLSVVGVYGVGFFIMLFASSVRVGPRAWPVWVGIAVVALLPAPEIEKGAMVPTIPVAAMQSEASSFDWFEKHSRELKDKPALVLWPEQSLPFDVMKSEEGWPRLQKLAKDLDAVVVLGTQQKGQGKEWFNTALTLDGKDKLGTHVKRHLVHYLNDGTPGKTAEPVVTPLGKVGTPICFDCDFEDVARKMTLAGAEFFAVPSMDVASWSLTQHLQHAQLMRIRAAENGRWFVVAATSGVTQIIDPRGQITASLEPMTSGVLEGKVGKSTLLTFYTRAGWMLPLLAMVAALGFLTAARRDRSAQMGLEQASSVVE